MLWHYGHNACKNVKKQAAPSCYQDTEPSTAKPGDHTFTRPGEWGRGGEGKRGGSRNGERGTAKGGNPELVLLRRLSRREVRRRWGKKETRSFTFTDPRLIIFLCLLRNLSVHHHPIQLLKLSSPARIKGLRCSVIWTPELTCKFVLALFKTSCVLDTVNKTYRAAVSHHLFIHLLNRSFQMSSKYKTDSVNSCSGHERWRNRKIDRRRERRERGKKMN